MLVVIVYVNVPERFLIMKLYHSFQDHPAGIDCKSQNVNNGVIYSPQCSLKAMKAQGLYELRFHYGGFDL